MRVEFLESAGGVLVYNDIDKLLISRLSDRGETRISFGGFDFDYDPDGNLVYAIVRVTEFLATQDQWLAQTQPDFRDFFGFLLREKAECMMRIDWKTKKIEFQRWSGQIMDINRVLTLREIREKYLQVFFEGAGRATGFMRSVWREICPATGGGLG